MEQTTLKFPRDSKESVETLFGKHILPNFPNYGVLWEKLIGQKNRKGSDYLYPYGLSVPLSLTNREKENIKTIYERFTMAHYSLFCALASAHYQYGVLQKQYVILKKGCKKLTLKQSIFKHWDSLENIYMNLGNAFYQVYHIWKLYFAFNMHLNIPRSELLERIDNIRTTRTQLKNHCRSSRKVSVFNVFRKYEEAISIMRDNVVHFARAGAIIRNNKFWLPFRLRRNVNWRRQIQKASKMKGVISTDRMAQRDILNAEEQINNMHSILIKDLTVLYHLKGFRVRHPWR